MGAKKSEEHNKRFELDTEDITALKRTLDDITTNLDEIMNLYFGHLHIGEIDHD